MSFHRVALLVLTTSLLLGGCRPPEQLVEDGDTFTVSGQFGPAEKSYQKALEAKPGFVPALAGMAKMYEVQDMEDTAIEWYRKAIDAKATTDKERKIQADARKAIANIYLERGDEHQLKGRDDQAIAEYDKALEIKPEQMLIDEIKGHKDNILFKRFRDKELRPRFDKVEERLRKGGSKVFWVPETFIFVCEGSAHYDPKEWKGKSEAEYGEALQKQAHQFIVDEMTRWAFALAQVPREKDDPYKVANSTVRAQQWVDDDYVIQAHLEREEMFKHAYALWVRDQEKGKK